MKKKNRLSLGCKQKEFIINRVEFTQKKCKTAVFLDCFGTAIVLHTLGP